MDTGSNSNQHKRQSNNICAFAYYQAVAVSPGFCIVAAGDALETGGPLKTCSALTMKLQEQVTER